MTAGSLYEIAVAPALQAIAGAGVFLRKGLEWCEVEGIDPQRVVETRLHPDMLPFSYQVVCMKSYSADAIDAARTGVFPPPSSQGALSYPDLIQMMDHTTDRLKVMTEASVDSISTPIVAFKHPEGDMPFTLRHFFLSFALPNLYFHATTAYDILRMKGVPLGKLDYIGPLRFAH